MAEEIQDSGNQKRKRETCAHCKRPMNACLCSSLPSSPIDNSLCKIFILQDPRTQISIGTVQLLPFCFQYCKIFIGKDFSEAKFPELDKILCQPNTFLLFPCEGAIDIASETKFSKEFYEQGINLIGIDGSWRFAKELYRNNQQIFQEKKIRSIKFDEERESIFGSLKKEPTKNSVSTAEAIASAVSWFEHKNFDTYNNLLEAPLNKIVQIQGNYYKPKPKVKWSELNEHEQDQNISK